MRKVPSPAISIGPWCSGEGKNREQEKEKKLQQKITTKRQGIIPSPPKIPTFQLKTQHKRLMLVSRGQRAAIVHVHTTNCWFVHVVLSAPNIVLMLHPRPAIPNQRPAGQIRPARAKCLAHADSFNCIHAFNVNYPEKSDQRKQKIASMLTSYKHSVLTMCKTARSQHKLFS